MPSRALFKAYTHVEPFLEIPAGEQQGAAPPDAPPKFVDPDASAELATSVGAAVQHLFDVQVWNWTLVELGQMPACLFGAVNQNGFGCPMLKSPGCVFNPHTHRWPDACKANVSSCKQTYQASDDRGNLPWTTSMSKYTSNLPPLVMSGSVLTDCLLSQLRWGRRGRARANGQQTSPVRTGCWTASSRRSTCTSGLREAMEDSVISPARTAPGCGWEGRIGFPREIHSKAGGIPH